MFLGTLPRVAEVIDSPLTNEVRAALETALRCFTEAAPKHTADEEESLFPRLRHIHHRDVESALAALNALEDEHRRTDALHAEVHALGLQSLDQGRLPLEGAGRFRQAVRDLLVIYGEHIRIEDDVSGSKARIVWPAEIGYCEGNGAPARAGFAGSQTLRTRLEWKDSGVGRRDNGCVLSHGRERVPVHTIRSSTARPFLIVLFARFDKSLLGLCAAK